MKMSQGEDLLMIAATNVGVKRLPPLGAMIETRETVRHESALAKVMADELGQKLTAFAMDLLGPFAPLTEASRWAPLRGTIQHAYLTSLGHTIAGGTSEILRTTVATRGLGLPSER